MVTKKRVLITAGPTWVAIDKVRVISNIATGETGILLAQKLRGLGAEVTLLLGPVGEYSLHKKIKLIRFKFFDELKNLITKELKSKKYAAVIHSAAVSDYKPIKFYAHKIKSGMRKWKLNLIPTAKIIDLIRSIDQHIFLVGFKFEPDIKKDKLIKEAKVLMHYSKLNLVVANTIMNSRYRAYIVGRDSIFGPIFNRENLTQDLIKVTLSNLR